MTASVNLFKQYPNEYFIETGSGTGVGIQMAIDAGFPTIISIELSKKLYNLCNERFKNNPNVILYYNDSAKILYNVIKHIDEPITFWLDAHYCGYTEGYLSAHNKRKTDPVVRELRHIKKHKIKNHTIIIDDMDYLGHLELENLVRDINKDYKIKRVDGNHKDSILIATL